MSQRSGAVTLSSRQNARLRERVEELRKREELSERALATRAEISIGAVRTIGRTKTGPTLGTLLALTRALRLQSIDQLLGPSPTALLTAQDELEAKVGEDAMNIVMLSDHRH